MTDQTTAPAGVVSSTELGLLPIGPHDHPEPRTMMWSALEIAAIKEYAARCMTAERERIALAWDGCRYEGMPCDMDIGASIRAGAPVPLDGA